MFIQQIIKKLSIFLFLINLAHSEIPLLQTPFLPISENESVIIKWQALTEDVCVLEYSRVPEFEGANFLNQTQKGEITFIPNNVNFQTGIYYARIKQKDSNNFSTIFRICIDANQVPLMNKPDDLFTITLSQLPLIFSWTKVENVPFYHIIVSDMPITLDKSGKNIKVKNISPIWQAITSSSTINYGDLDPSGTFNNTQTPPLFHGGKYSWVVLNNYDNTIVMTSPRINLYRDFKVNFSPINLEQAQLLSPLNNTIIGYNADDKIDFTWNPVSGATHYYFILYIFLGGTEGESSVYNKIWESFTTQPSITLTNASKILSNYEFKWKVLALDETNTKKSSCSEIFGFKYQINTANLNLYIKDISNASPISRAYIRLNQIPGEILVIETIVDDKGEIKDIKLPIGKYRITVTKTGYKQINEDIIEINQQNIGTNISKAINLKRNTATFLGKIKNFGGGNIVGALIEFTSLDVENITKTTFTDEYGWYCMDLPFQTDNITEIRDWTIKISKSGFKTIIEKISLSFGQNLQKDFILYENAAIVSGNIKNANNDQLLENVLVKAINEKGTTFSTKTNNEGKYEFLLEFTEEGLLWNIEASFNGYISTSQSILLKTEDEKILNFKLISADIILKGFILDVKSKTRISSAKIIVTKETNESLETFTNTIGFYELGLKKDLYQIIISADGYWSLKEELDFRSINQSISDKDFYLTPFDTSYTLSGKITENGTTEISNATIKVATNNLSFEKSSLSAINGFYSIEKIPQNQISITANKEGYISGLLEKAINANDFNFNILLPLKHTSVKYGKGDINIKIDKFINKQFEVTLKWKTLLNADWKTLSTIIVRENDGFCNFIIPLSLHQVQKGEIFYQIEAECSGLSFEIKKFQSNVYTISMGTMADKVEITPSFPILGKESFCNFEIVTLDKQGNNIDMEKMINEGKIEVKWEIGNESTVALNQITWISGIAGKSYTGKIKANQKGEIILKAKVNFKEVEDQKITETKITISESKELKIYIRDSNMYNGMIKSTDPKVKFICEAIDTITGKTMESNLITWSNEPKISGRTQNPFDEENYFYFNHDEFDFRFIGEITVIATDNFNKIKSSPYKVTVLSQFLSPENSIKKLGNDKFEILLSNTQYIDAKDKTGRIWLQERDLKDEEKKNGKIYCYFF
ncbi:MAG: hypothetical protein ABIB46_02380 [bacterium]